MAPIPPQQRHGRLGAPDATLASGTSLPDMQALSGIRVLDISQMWAAPATAMYLADHGADVIKVEPLGGDEGRRTLTQPPVAGGESRAFLALNRNKRSLALDIRHPPGPEGIRELVPRGARPPAPSSAGPTSSSTPSGPASPSGSATTTRRSGPSTSGSSTRGSP